MKAGNINPAGWEAVATDRRHWRLDDKAGIQACEERRAEQRDERRERWRLRAASYPYPPSQTRNSSAATVRRACRCRIGLYSQRRRCNSITHSLNLGADSIVSRDRRVPTTSTNRKRPVLIWTKQKCLENFHTSRPPKHLREQLKKWVKYRLRRKNSYHKTCFTVPTEAVLQQPSEGRVTVWNVSSLALRQCLYCVSAGVNQSASQPISSQ